MIVVVHCFRHSVTFVRSRADGTYRRRVYRTSPATIGRAVFKRLRRGIGTLRARPGGWSYWPK